MVNRPNPEKSSARIAINSSMAGVALFIFTLIWALNPAHYSWIIISQLVLSIPLFYISLMAYTKLGYYADHKDWELYGWWTNTTGNHFILNVVGLMTSLFYITLAYAYFGILILLTSIYYIIKLKHSTKPVKTWLRYFYFILLLIVGGILPVALHVV